MDLHALIECLDMPDMPDIIDPFVNCNKTDNVI